MEIPPLEWAVLYLVPFQVCSRIASSNFAREWKGKIKTDIYHLGCSRPYIGGCLAPAPVVSVSHLPSSVFHLSSNSASNVIVCFGLAWDDWDVGNRMFCLLTHIVLWISYILMHGNIWKVKRDKITKCYQILDGYLWNRVAKRHGYAKCIEYFMVRWMWM